MAETDTEIIPNGTGTLSEEDERMKQRPADIDADVREMERRKRVEALMSSKLFREELERVLDQQMHEGADAPLLQRIKEMVGGRLQTGSFRGPSCVLPINDIRGIEGVGYEKGEKILRCKLAALYRLVDLFGWTQTGVASQLTARLNTAVEQLLISPRGLMPHEVTASSLLKVDMQGTVIDSGTTNYGVHKSGFSVHAAVHAARPDVRCVLHLRSPPVLAISATKQGLLPLCTEAALIGDVAYHRVPTGILDNEERDKIVRVLGPSCKILFLRSQGALCCGSTLEEAFYHAKHLHTAADVQLKLATVPRDQLAVMDDEERKEVYDASRAEGAAESNKWRAGGEEFEALMRMLDNAGFRTGYIYRNPLVKNDVPRPKNDVEVPPAVSSLGYLLEEEEMYRQGLWKKGQGKTGERTRWLNSPNVYQKVEVLETGTNDPKKITKWVDSHNEEWVTDGSPGHSSTPMKIDAALQFVPKNTNPKEFKALQQQIKDNRRADKISAGPQSHILEGVTWDEANRLNADDASATHTGDHVVLVGAASKGIIQRGYQHNATVYSAPYARNPFEHVSERDLDEYTRRVTGQNNYDTDLSESEAISAAQMTSPVSETETESRDDATDFLNAERSHVDRTRGITQNPKPTRSPNPFTDNKKRDYPRCPNFESLILKYDSPKNDPKCKVNLKKRYDSEPTHADAVEMYNPGCLSSRGSLYSVPSIEWDVKKTDNFRSQSLPRKLGRKEQQQRYYRSCSHAGFINTFIKNPEPIHYHMPKCRKCGSFNSSYDWEITKRDLKSLGQSSIWHSYENIHKSCLREGDRKVLAICDVVRVKEMDTPVFEVNTEFIDSEEYNEDCYLENTYLSSSTVVENASLNRTLVKVDVVVVERKINADLPIDTAENAIAIDTYTENDVKNVDIPNLNIDSEENKLVDQPNIDQEVLGEVKSGEGVDENGVYRAECVYIKTSDSSDKSDSHSKSPESNKINADVGDDIIQELAMGIEGTALDDVIEEPNLNVDLNSFPKLENTEIIASEIPSYVDSSVYRVFRTVLKELKSKLRITATNEPENKIDFTVDVVEGEYLNFTNELDFDRAVYDSPVKNLITKDVRDFLVPLNFYAVKESPSKFNTSLGKPLDTILEETKVSDSSNDSVKDSSGDRNSIENKSASEIHSNDGPNIVGKTIDRASIEDCVNKVNNDKEDLEVDLPVPKSAIADLSGLEVCENYKISIESSSNEIPSFDSTAEFEKIEAVADVLGILIKRVSITIVNKDENDFYTTVDQALKIKHKGVKFFDLPETEGSDESQDVDLYKEPEAFIDREPIITESDDINDYQTDCSSVFIQKVDDDKCKEDFFSILEIVKNIDQEIVGHNLTVLSEDSDLDPKTHPFKVCESIVYHILCTVYCQIKQKYKRNKVNGKAVVTVVDSEDIMFTALPIWDNALIDEVTVKSKEENEELKPTVDAETPDHYGPYNPSEVLLEANKIQDDLPVLSNNNDLIFNNEDTDIIPFEEFKSITLDLQDEAIIKELNVARSLHCKQEDLEAEKSKIPDVNVEITAERRVLTEIAVSEVKGIISMNDEIKMDRPGENYECFVEDENVKNEDTTYGLITEIVNDAVHGDDFVIVSENEGTDVIPSEDAKDIYFGSGQEDKVIVMELDINKDSHCKQEDSVVELSDKEYIHEDVEEVVLLHKHNNFGLIADMVSDIVDNAVNEDDHTVLQGEEKVCSDSETSRQATDIVSPLTPDINLKSSEFEGSVQAEVVISNIEEQPIMLIIVNESRNENNIKTDVDNETFSEIRDASQIIPEVAENQKESNTDIAVECVENIKVDISQESFIDGDTQSEELEEKYDDNKYTAQVPPNSPEQSMSIIQTDEGCEVLSENCDASHIEPNEVEKQAEMHTNISLECSTKIKIDLPKDLSIDKHDAQSQGLPEDIEMVDHETQKEHDQEITPEEPTKHHIEADVDNKSLSKNCDGSHSEQEVVEVGAELNTDTNIQSCKNEAIDDRKELLEEEFYAKSQHTSVAIESSKSEVANLLMEFITNYGIIETEGLDEKVDVGETHYAQVQTTRLQEVNSSNSNTVPEDNEQEDMAKESELVAVEQINRIILNITLSRNKNEEVNETSSNIDSLKGQYEDDTTGTKFIALEEISQIISDIPDGTDEYDQENIVTINSALPISDTVDNDDDDAVTDLKSLERPTSNLNPNAVPFFMNYYQAEETLNEETLNNDPDLNLSEIVQQDVFDILEDVLEVVSSMYERQNYENTYSVSPVESNESIEDLCVDEQDFALTNKSSVTEIGAIEEKEDEEAFKIITIDVSKSLEESRLLSHIPTRDETTGSLHDDPIVLDVYDTQSYGKDEENKYVTELNIAIKGYPTEYDEYNDSSNGSNEDNELFIEKHRTPKFVDLVTRDEDGSIDSITYNSHILQTIVENLLQDVISEFVIDDNVSEIINTEVTKDTKEYLRHVKTKVPDDVVESFSCDDKEQNIDIDVPINKNETFVLDSNNPMIKNINISEDNAEYEVSCGDAAYESCSKTDLDQTYVLGADVAKDNSELTEDISYFDTAFCEDTMLTNQSSPYKNNSPIFTSCDESPIKNPNTAYLDDSMLYEKCDEISPFDKTVAVQSMSQCVNAGGVKYWLSFDDSSFTEIDDKVKSNRGRKSRDIPTFYSFDTVEDLPAKSSSNNDNVFKHKTSDSSVYMTASCSKSKVDAWTSCNQEPSTSKTDENERRLLFDCSKRSKKKFVCAKRSKKVVRRREYDTWPPYDESLFYRIISNFRMSESFDLSDLDNVDYR